MTDLQTILQILLVAGYRQIPVYLYEASFGERAMVLCEALMDASHGSPTSITLAGETIEMTYNKAKQMPHLVKIIDPNLANIEAAIAREVEQRNYNNIELQPKTFILEENRLSLGPGRDVAYSESRCEFTFDSSGKFIDHACYE